MIIKRKSLTQKTQSSKMERLEVGKLEGLEVNNFFCWRSRQVADTEAGVWRVLKSRRPESGAKLVFHTSEKISREN